jgi:hypothetical protein
MQVENKKRYRAFLIIMAYLIIAIMGIRSEVIYHENTSYDLLCIVIFALLLTDICVVDSKIVGKPLSIFYYWVVFVFYGIAVPVCIIRAHGIKGLGIVLLHYIGLSFTMGLSSYITWLLMKQVI